MPSTQFPSPNTNDDHPLSSSCEHMNRALDNSNRCALFVFQLTHLARQALYVLNENARNNRNGSPLKRLFPHVSTVSICAADLTEKAKGLAVSHNTTIMLAVSCMKTAYPSAFGCEGQFNNAIAEFAHEHATAAGRARVVAVLVAPSDNECIVPQGTTTGAFADEWRRKTLWPHRAIAVFVPTLRRLSSDADVAAAMKLLPQLNLLLTDGIPERPTLELESDETETAHREITLRCNNIDADSLRIAAEKVNDNGVEVFANAANNNKNTATVLRLVRERRGIALAVWNETVEQWRQFGQMQVSDDDNSLSHISFTLTTAAPVQPPIVFTRTLKIQLCDNNKSLA